MYFTNPEIVMMKYGALLEMKFRNYSVHLWNNNMEPHLDYVITYMYGHEESFQHLCSFSAKNKNVQSTVFSAVSLETDVNRLESVFILTD